MVVADQSFHVHCPPTHLLPVHVADQRPVARVFLAHAASLLFFVQFSRTNLDGFLHSFVFKGAGFLFPLSVDRERRWKSTRSRGARSMTNFTTANLSGVPPVSAVPGWRACIPISLSSSSHSRR